MVKLSVIIPTYNRKESLLRTLAALEKQTLPVDRFEVIVISDGSTDGTSDAISSTSFSFEVGFFEQQNSGPSVARNFGAQKANNEVIVFLDDDIEPIPQRPAQCPLVGRCADEREFWKRDRLPVAAKEEPPFLQSSVKCRHGDGPQLVDFIEECHAECFDQHQEAVDVSR